MSARPILDRTIERRLLEEGAEIVRRLHRVCADWPEDRFGDLVHAAALARLKDAVSPDVLAHLRSGETGGGAAFLARVGECAD